MGFAAWPAYADDIGDKISGTIINKALLDAIKADIEADVFSAVNPALSPKNIIDEVVTARGTKASLDARLDVSLNADGTLAPITALATQTQLLSQLGQQNLVLNGNFDQIPYLSTDAIPGGAPAATNVPEGWTLTGAGASITRCGPGEADTTNLGTGQWCEKIIAAGVDAPFAQTVIPAAEMTDHQLQIGSKKVQFYIVYKTAGANSLQLEIADGAGTTTGALLPAAAVPTLATLERTIDPTATSLTVRAITKAGSTVYIGGLGMIVSDLPPTKWPYEPGIWYRKGSQRLASFSALNHACGAGAYQVDLTLLGGIPANALTDSSLIRVSLVGTMANNANQKNLQLVLGTNTFTVFALAAGAASAIWTVHGYIQRTGNTSASFYGIATMATASGSAPTLWHLSGAFAGGAHNFTTNVPFKIQLYGVAGTDNYLQSGVIELIKG